MRNNKIYRDQHLPHPGLFFLCSTCNGDGSIEDDYGIYKCDACENEGMIDFPCEITFDIEPGEFPTMCVAPENCDPGYGPEIYKVVVSINGLDMTDTVVDMDEVDEYIRNNWQEPTIVND